jgi:hypothetical protein
MGYDADRIRQELLVRGVLPVVPSNPARTTPLPLDRELYRLRAVPKTPTVCAG